MPTCREIAALATDQAEGALGAAERARYEAHLAGCPACAAHDRQLRLAARAAAALPEPALPLALQEALLARFDERAARRAASVAALLRWLRPALVLAAFGVLVAMGRNRSGRPGDWAVGLALAALAVALAVRGGRAGLGLAGLTAAAVAVAALFGEAGPLHALTGVDCLAAELGAVAGTAGATWLVLRRGGALAGTPLGALAVAGALAGAAALQITCGSHASSTHALAFHLGGVVLVGGLAALWPRPGLRPA